jgi:hypothetical protein
VRFHVVTEEKAKEILDLIENSLEPQPDAAAFQSLSGAGETLPGHLIDEVASKLKELRQQFAEDTKRFDAEACIVLHQALPSDVEMLSNDGFWRWLALGPLRDLILWRFPRGKKVNDLGDEVPLRLHRPNFGVGASARQRAECFPYKLWLRAELGHVAGAAEPYRYAKRGDVDFWTSHIHRQSYTTNRRLCSALVRFQYPDEREGRPRLLSGTENKDKRRLGIRTLAKRLRRLQASFELTVLDDAQLDDLVIEQATGLTPAA